MNYNKFWYNYILEWRFFIIDLLQNYNEQESLNIEHIERLLNNDIINYSNSKIEAGNSLGWVLDNSISELGKKIAKKFEIENVTNNDSDIGIFKIMKGIYWGNNTLLDMNSPKYLNELKQYISNHLKELIKYKYDFNNEKYEEISEYIGKNVNKIVNNFSNQYLNNNYRDKMEKIQKEWDIAYEYKDYDKLDKVSEQLKNNYSNGFYKDFNLEYKNFKSILIDTVFDNKRKNGEKLELTDMEKKVIEDTLKFFDSEYMDNMIKGLKSELEKTLKVD